MVKKPDSSRQWREQMIRNKRQARFPRLGACCVMSYGGLLAPQDLTDLESFRTRLLSLGCYR